MNKRLNVLLVEDTEEDALLVLLELRGGGFNVIWERVETADALRIALTTRSWDVLISDYRLPQLDAFAALAIAQQSQPNLPFIAVSGTIGEALAVEIMKAGAHDYLMKDSLVRLPEAVRREVREAQIRAERQQTILELAQTKERLQLAIEGSGIGLWDWSVQTGAVTFNDRWAEIIGYTLQALAPISIETWRQHTHPDDLQYADLRLEQHFRQETPVYECELRMRHQAGHWVWVLARGKVVDWDTTGKPLRMIGTHLDMTDRKQAEATLQHLNQDLERRVALRTAALQQTNQELARATRLKDEFLANMSHELRTPLTAILGMSESLKERIFGELNAKQQQYVEVILNSGKHLLQLINDILDVSQISAGRLKLDIAPVSIYELCTSSLTFVEQTALEKQIQLTTRLSTDLGIIDVDERRIRQVLLNLLNNAVKFTPIGGQVTLEVKTQPSADTIQTATQAVQEPQQLPVADSWLLLTIADTGIGIAPEDQAKLFQPFVQLDGSLNRKYEGTGLGLTLVKQIVERHQGSVSFTSQVGQGSCFTVSLPYCQPCPAAPIAAQIPSLPRLTPTTAGAARWTGDRPLILLAEDNQGNIDTFSHYLEVHGYQMLIARNGQEAIALTQAHYPDLILIDIQMPDVDGLEAIQTIRQDPQLANIPIIALTALAMDGDRSSCLTAGANDYLSKPVKLKQLVTTMQQLLAFQ